jgi:hypothetical protein
MSVERYEIVTFDPGNEDTFPSVCPTADDVRRRFGFAGGERLLFTEQGAYVGQIVDELPAIDEGLLCGCGHTLGAHRETDGPGHAGCQDCQCPGFVSADLDVHPETYARVRRVLDLAAPVAQMLEAGTTPERIHELVDVAVSEYEHPTPEPQAVE